MIDPDDIFEILYATANRNKPNSLKGNDFTGPIRVKYDSNTAIGRSLIATRDVKQGELLFILSPLLRANVDQAREIWLRDRTNDGTASSEHVVTLSDIAETLLVEACRNCEDANVLQSCLTLVGSTFSNSSESSLDILLGCASCTDTGTPQKGSEIAVSEWQQIIRRNAFGSDFITSDYIEQRWLSDLEIQGRDVSTWFRPGRLLSIYPLAAMINHSCIPNAVRLFVNHKDGNEFMIVHACQNIPKDDEIVWSYVPVIDSYTIRLKTLKSSHNFMCQCSRCMAEAHLWKTSECLLRLSRNITKLLSSTNKVSEISLSDMDALQQQVHSLEHDLLLPSNSFVSSSNEVKRFLRVGFFRLYSTYLNGCLLECQKLEQNDRLKTKKELLSICTQLHFALAACHNASTEHISVSDSTFTTRHRVKSILDRLTATFLRFFICVTI